MNLGDVDVPDIAGIVAKTIELIKEITIDIPRIIITPKGESRRKFANFNLDTSNICKFERIDRNITIRQLQSNIGFVIEAEEMDCEESPERTIVSALMDFNDIPYDDNNAVINSIAKQYADFVRSYETEEIEAKKIILFNRKEISLFLHDEMFKHEETQEIEYQATVSKGFRVVSSNSYLLTSCDNRMNFRNPVFTKRDIKDILFVGYKKCLFPSLKFDSDTERRFSVILEDSQQVLRWFKPTTNDIMIYYESGKEYEPDFIVETEDLMLLIETKAEKDVETDTVQNKAKAAITWCEYATKHALNNDGKPWKYVLIPDVDVLPNATLDGFVKRFGK